MGTKLSRLLFTWKAAQHITALYEELSKRISLSPGIPVPNPTVPYWSDPPSPVSHHGCEAELPQYADIVIIGSGITGTAIARTILDHFRDTNAEKSMPSIVMLDARDACYGATGRNGGHITPPLYLDYSALKEGHGLDMARKIMRFRLAHLDNLLAVAEEEGLFTESQCRKVQTYDVFFDAGLFRQSKDMLATYMTDLPTESEPFRVIEDRAELQQLQLSDKVIGCISTTAGAIHPYRLVTGILSRLLDEYSTKFQLFTRSPCTSIESVADSYLIHTSKGILRAQHVVHATNAWSSHLLAGMRRKIVPLRADMTAQRPGQGLSRPSTTWAGKRSFVFYPGKTFNRIDYLTQQPVSPSGNDVGSNSAKPAGEFMFGGGLQQGGLAEAPFLESFGNADDSSWNFAIVSFLGGAAALYFSGFWGREGRGVERAGMDMNWAEGRIKGHWSGIIGMSADEMPWVGPIPDSVTGRPISRSFGSAHLSPSSEWICAGFSGEGMTQAWLSAKATAAMILGPSLIRSKGERKKNTQFQLEHTDWQEWFPELYLVTERRWRAANIDEWVWGDT